MKRYGFYLLGSTLLILLLFGGPWSAQAQAPEVHAVLFYSQTCPYCHQVMQVDLPPLLEAYGDQLKILTVDVQRAAGSRLYQSYLDHFQIAAQRRGVPALVAGETVMVGAVEIPEIFPGLVESGVAANGIPWPSIPGMQDYLDREALTFLGDETGSLTFLASARERFMLDPGANAVAVLVLLGMLASVYWVIASIYRNLTDLKTWPVYAIPSLLLIGLAVSAYLSYVEITHTTAICGPVGDCNAIQNSPYAYLFGVIPVGVLGIVGYLTLGISWFSYTLGSVKTKRNAAITLWVLTLLGTLYSIYLTFLEPFVIGAVCAWCLISAIVMTAVLWAATPLALDAMQVGPTRRRRHHKLKARNIR